MGLFSSAPSRVLALHWDGITTTGAVFKRAKGKPQEIARATAHHVDPGAALTSLLKSLKKAGTAAPKQVILACDRAVLARVELPVHPDRPRPYEQMRELARWESEMAFSDLPSWNVDNVLMAMRAVDAAADARIRAEIETRVNNSIGGPTPRYQDVALSMGLIDRPTRDAAVEFRENLNQPVGESGVGWVPVKQPHREDFAQHNWLVSAVSEFDRDAWREACALNKMDLLGIVPSWGLSDLMVPDAPPEGSTENNACLLIERHSGSMSLVHKVGDAVESIRLINLNRPDMDESEMLQRILGGREQSRAVAVGFGPEAQRTVRAIFPHAELIEDTPGTVLAGVAGRGMGLKKAADWPALIAKAEPKPPIYKSDNFFRAALIVGVLVAIGGTDGYTRIKKSGLDLRLEELDQEYKDRRKIVSAINNSIGEARRIETEIQTAKAEIESFGKQVKAATYLQQRRQLVVQGLLDGLRRSIPNGVVVRYLEEEPTAPEVFTLSAWALTEVDAEEFIAQLNQALAPVGLAVAGESVFAQPGPKKLDGYGAELRIVPLHRGGVEDDAEGAGQ